MQVLVPLTIDDARFVSSSIPENDYGASAWNSGTTYSVGNYVLYNHRVYQALLGSNLNKIPDQQPTYWNDLGPTNRWAMFDSQVGTISSSTSDIVVVITPNAVINGIGLVAAIGNTVRVQVIDPIDGTVYDQTQTIESAPMTSWYDYFFADESYGRHIYFENLPLYYSAPITVTISGAGTKSVGCLLFGTMHNVGAAQYGASSDFKDYSRKTTDNFGTYTFLQRGYADKGSYTLQVEKSEIPKIRALRPLLRALPCMWICDSDGDLDIFVHYGWFSDWKVVLNWPTFAICQLGIEGLA